MTYFPLSDEFHSMPELLGASDAAVALYARAASWSACHLTDGHVPTSALPLLTASYEQAPEELVRRKVWRRARGGFQFAAWPKEATRSNVEAKREANRQRQQRNRTVEATASRRDTRVSNGVSHGVTHGVSHSPHATPHHTNGSPTGEPPCSPPPAEHTRAAKRAREPDRFAEFYDAFPRHKDRQAAARKFAQVVASGVDPDTLITAAKRYRADVAGTEARYVKHPSTWLNKGCWHDEPDPQPHAPLSTADQRVLEAQRLREAPPDDDGFGRLRVIEP